MNEYGRSRISSYPNRYRGTSSRRDKANFNMFLGKRGLITGTARWVGHSIFGTPHSNRRSSRTKTYYTFKTSSDLPQKSLIDINLEKISNRNYSELIKNYYRRIFKYEEFLTQQHFLRKVLKKRRLYLKVISCFIYRFLFKAKIKTVTEEIDIRVKQLDNLNHNLKLLNTSLIIGNNPNELSPHFVDSFNKLFGENKVNVLATSEYDNIDAIPTYCHYYRIGRKPVIINKKEGPLENAKFCSINIEGLSLYFYSSILLIKNSKGIAIIDYKDLSLVCGKTVIVEDEFFDINGYNVYGYEYLHQCKDGTIDLRYKYNPERPKILYNTIMLTLKENVLLCLIIDKEKSIPYFIQSFESLKQRKRQ